MNDEKSPVENLRTLSTVKAGECRWEVEDVKDIYPEGHPVHKTNDYKVFCGDATTAGHHYCDAHKRKLERGSLYADINPDPYAPDAVYDNYCNIHEGWKRRPHDIPTEGYGTGWINNMGVEPDNMPERVDLMWGDLSVDFNAAPDDVPGWKILPTYEQYSTTLRAWRPAAPPEEPPPISEEDL